MSVHLIGHMQSTLCADINPYIIFCQSLWLVSIFAVLVCFCLQIFILHEKFLKYCLVREVNRSSSLCYGFVGE